MSFEPKQKNKSADVLIAALFLCAGVAYGFSVIESIKGKGILQMLALVLVGAMTHVFIRYKLTSFRYSVRVSQRVSSLHHEDDEAETETVPEGGENAPVTSLAPELLELVVDRWQGKGTPVSECVIKLKDMECCCALPHQREKWDKIYSENKRLPRYKYMKNMSIAEQMAIIATVPTGKVMIFLEWDKKLFEYLSAVCEYNRTKKQ
ncbi:MAG: hypothetical protein IJD22_00915 [Clostridia bacterium]|nr:hypothetical protein [Clostridia bacterium]